MCLSAPDTKHLGNFSITNCPKRIHFGIPAFLDASQPENFSNFKHRPANSCVFKRPKHKNYWKLQPFWWKFQQSKVLKTQKAGKYQNITQNTSQANSNVPTKRFFVENAGAIGAMAKNLVAPYRAILRYYRCDTPYRAILATGG